MQKLDWEQRVIDVCEKMKIDPIMYNQNDDLKEFIAKYLGFSNFKEFDMFPSPKNVLHGVGGDIDSLAINPSIVYLLLNGIIYELNYYYLSYKNIENLNSYAKNSFDWVNRNCSYELIEYFKQTIIPLNLPIDHEILS